MNEIKIVDPVLTMEGPLYRLYKIEYPDNNARLDIILKGEDYTELNEYINNNFTRREYDTIEPLDKKFRSMLKVSNITLKYDNGLLDIRGKGTYRELVAALKTIPNMKDLFMMATKDEYFKNKYEQTELEESLEL